jgi:hypothetical protein
VKREAKAGRSLSLLMQTIELEDSTFIKHNFYYFSLYIYFDKERGKNISSSVTGLEPAIPRSEVWCLIH